MKPYQDNGPIICDTGFETSNVNGKTAVITGGANGMGEAYVRSLVQAGAFVVFGDLDATSGRKIESELGSSTAQFVSCDVLSWKDQLAMFKQAVTDSPSKRVDIVIANAGIATLDDCFTTNPDEEDPEEPTLKVAKVDGIGVLYTTKLALHYFRRQFKQNPEASKDQLLILQGSLAGYIDLPGAMQYSFSKYGMRGMMRNLRRTEHVHGIRTNYIAPWFIKTAIMDPGVVEALEKGGVPFATVPSAAKAVMKLCSDPNINGRTLSIIPESMSESGYVDMAVDEWQQDPWKSLQKIVLGGVQGTSVA